MLILTRRASEVLMIGDDIKITILNINKNNIRIGIDAPDDVNILREEIAEKYRKKTQGENNDDTPSTEDI